MFEGQRVEIVRNEGEVFREVVSRACEGVPRWISRGRVVKLNSSERLKTGKLVGSAVICIFVVRVPSWWVNYVADFVETIAGKVD